MQLLSALRASVICPLFALGLAASAGPSQAPPGDVGANGCGSAYCADDAVFQAVPLQGLLAGVLESPIAFSAVLAQGDFGLGGMSPLDGEVIVLDGLPYHARVDGEVRAVDPAEPTATLWVKRFRADRRFEIPEITGLDALLTELDAALGMPNRIHAIRIDGRFHRLVLRSVPRQTPPYASVTEVVKSQNVYTLENVEGTLVGFRFPDWAAGINAPGYHFHFVDAGRRRGGHVLDVAADRLVALVDTSRAVTVITPDDALFDGARLSVPGNGSGYQRALRPDVQSGTKP